MCLYPRLIRNPKYKANTKNGGVIPALKDKRVLLVPIGCGDCMECRKQKSRQWQVRLFEEIKQNRNGKFVTFTFSKHGIKKVADDVKDGLTNYGRQNAIATRAMRLFLERWRKKYGKSLRHWMITELGHNGTKRIHLHGIIFTDVDMKEIEKIWGYGMIWKGNEKNGKIENYVDESTVNYIVKYITKQDKTNKGYRGVILCSPGIGNGYTKRHDSTLNKFNGKETKEYYRSNKGIKINLPIYYRNKIYSEEERENLWLMKLDKEERWVNGEKVSVKNGLGNYFRLLNYHREINREMGYEVDERKWCQEAYEKMLAVIRE